MSLDPQRHREVYVSVFYLFVCLFYVLWITLPDLNKSNINAQGLRSGN